MAWRTVPPHAPARGRGLVPSVLGAVEGVWDSQRPPLNRSCKRMDTMKRAPLADNANRVTR